MTSARFLEGSILRHVAVMTSTAAIGMMALFVVDLVDLFFLSLLGGTEVAAVGFAGSVVLFTRAVCISLSIAMGALVARAIGAGKPQDARRYIINVGVTALAVTVPMAALFWLATPQLLAILGAEDRTLALASTFLHTVLPSMPVLAIALSAVGVIRALGAARLAMFATLAGGFVNAVLDPILIFGFDMGIAGAAWASVFARATVLVIGVYVVLSKVKMVGPLEATKYSGDMRRLAAIAGPAVLANLATPVGNSYIVATMAQFGDDAVAALSIISRVIPVAFGLVLALSGAVGPVIGQNFGAGRHDRVRRILVDSLGISVTWVVFTALLLFAFQADIALAFGISKEANAVWQFFATFVAIFWVFSAAQFVAHAAFYNLGKALWSTWSNWGKATLGTIPFAWLGAAWLGPNGVLFGQAFGSMIFGFGAFIMAWRLSGAVAEGSGERSR